MPEQAMKKSTQHTTIPYILFKVFLRTAVNAIRSISGTGQNRTEYEGNPPVKQHRHHHTGSLHNA